MAHNGKLIRRNLSVSLDGMNPVASVPDVTEVAGALRVAVGLVVRKLRQAPYAGELTLAESAALSRLARGGRGAPPPRQATWRGWTGSARSRWARPSRRCSTAA